jgi:hypothetical protein
MISFQPMQASTVNISVAATTANVLIENFSGANQIRVFNNGSATAWIEFGGSGVVATLTSSIPIPAGAIEVFSVGSAASTVYAAAIAAASTGSIYFTPGSGL